MKTTALLQPVDQSPETPTSRPNGPVPRVLIVLVSPFLYGMERAVIELFDALRPAVDPVFLQSSRILQRNPPIVQEMRRRHFNIVLIPDKKDWPPPARPKSLRHFFSVTMAILSSNIAVFRAVKNQDILYVPGIRAGISSCLAAIYCRLTGRRVIHHFHDLGTGNAFFRIWQLLVTDFIHNTEFGYRAVTAQWPSVKRRRNTIVPCIMDVERSCDNDPELRQRFAGKRNLFFVGQVSRHKGVDLLLQAFEPIAREYHDVDLHLVGGCADDFRRELDGQLVAAGLNHRVHFWGFRDDALQLLRHAYLYVHSSPPSRFNESFGRSVVEAMALGVPTVCFRSGALQEIVVHEKTGLLCDESAADLANGMKRMLSTAEFGDFCGRRALDRFVECYSGDVVRRRWLKIFSNEIEFQY